jgi:predicted RNase H-like HicB family nuclease
MATYLEYMSAAIRLANFEQIENGQLFATIPQFDGLWAVGKTREEATRDLWSALDGWLDVHIKIGRHRPPEINGIDLFAAPKAIEE